MRGMIHLSTLALATMLAGPPAALAQSAGPVEAVGARGAVEQNLTLTAAQKSAIYNAVLQQGRRTPAAQLAAAIGAPVPPNVELRALPDEVSADNSWADLLKYALVENDIVVVDPIRMRVVDVIHGGAKP